jgi:hypothetical protein
MALEDEERIDDKINAFFLSLFRSLDGVGGSVSLWQRQPRGGNTAMLLV